MLPQAIAVGAVALGAKALLDRTQSNEHERLVQATYDTLQQEGPEANILVDDNDIGGTGNPEGVLPTDMVPDLILHAQETANLVIEVETETGLRDNEDHAEEQLEAFAAAGYRRVLVVPEDALEIAREASRDWSIDTEDVQLATPSTVHKAL